MDQHETPDDADGRPVHAVQLFGAFRVSAQDGAQVTPRGRKARALLAYLLLAKGEPIPRERFAGLLWSDRAEEQARASLRQTLYELRSLNSPTSPLVAFDRVSARTILGAATTDLDELRRLKGTGEADALAMVVGDHPRPLLADLDTIDAAFDEWLAVERVRRGDERRGIVLAVAERALLAGDAAGAFRLATSLLAVDPVDEAATCVAMEASRQRGDNHGIRQAYSRLELALRRDLNTTPALETVASYQRLTAPTPSSAPPVSTPSHAGARADLDGFVETSTTASHAPSERPATVPPIMARPHRTRLLRVGAIAVAVAVAALALWLVPRPAHRALIVEPLQTAAADGAAQTLKAGLSTDLARMIVGNGATLSVTERSGPGRPTHTKDLVVTGDAASSDGILHANIKLVGGDAVILWSHGFSAPVDKVDALRQEMAAKVADVALCGLGAYHPAPDSLDTMRLFLGACEQKHGDQDEAMKLLRQVVERQPGFAHGWAMLAAATATNAEAADVAMRRQADSFARRALALDPRESEAYYARAVARPGIEAWSARMAILQSGRTVDPTQSMINSTMAWNLGLVGRSHESIAYAEQANDPFSPGQTEYLAEALGFGGDLPAAADVLHLGRERFPLSRGIALLDFRLAALVGDPERASKLLASEGDVLGLGPDDIELWRRIIAARADPLRSNLDAAAQAILASAKNPERRGLGAVVKLVAIGRVEEAYAVAARLGPTDFAREDTDTLFWRVMAPFRADRRFMTLAAREGLAAIWLKSGKWPDFCGDKTLPYNCRTEAIRALRAINAKT